MFKFVKLTGGWGQYCKNYLQVSRCSTQAADPQRILRSHLRKQQIKQKLAGRDWTVPAPRAVTSLPPVPCVAGNEDFIALNIQTRGKFTVSDVIMIHAVSSKDSFVQICNSSLDSKTLSRMGLQHDVNSGKISMDGQPLENVTLKDAVQNLINFVKQYDNPMFIMFPGKYVYPRLNTLMDNFNVRDEMVSAVPYKIDVMKLALRTIPKAEVDDYKLATLCKKILNMEIAETGDLARRMTGTYRLFTEYLIDKEPNQLLSSLNFLPFRHSYTQLLVDGEIDPFVMDRLASQGLSLDHLKFLMQEKEADFNSFLQERKIDSTDIQKLYNLLSKRNE